MANLASPHLCLRVQNPGSVFAASVWGKTRTDMALVLDELHKRKVREGGRRGGQCQRSCSMPMGALCLRWASCPPTP